MQWIKRMHTDRYHSSNDLQQFLLQCYVWPPPSNNEAQICGSPQPLYWVWPCLLSSLAEILPNSRLGEKSCVWMGNSWLSHQRLSMQYAGSHAHVFHYQRDKNRAHSWCVILQPVKAKSFSSSLPSSPLVCVSHLLCLIQQEKRHLGVDTIVYFVFIQLLALQRCLNTVLVSSVIYSSSSRHCTSMNN